MKEIMYHDFLVQQIQDLEKELSNIRISHARLYEALREISDTRIYNNESSPSYVKIARDALEKFGAE